MATPDVIQKSHGLGFRVYRVDRVGLGVRV